MKKNKTILLFLILTISITSVIFNALFFYQQSVQENIKTKADVLDKIYQRLKNTYSEINNFPSGAADNLLFLSKLIEFNKIEEYFLEFLTQSEAYYQVSYINNDGKVLFLAEFDGKTRKIISDSVEKQKSSSYFDLLKNLKNGEVYMFPLILENKIPVLKYSTPVFNKKTNELKGIILIKVYADYFLENIRRSQREGEVTYLINNDGFYLANPDKNKEFGYLTENKENNFFIDYPAVSKDLIINCNERNQETDEQIFTYQCINPTIDNFETYEGSRTIDGKAANNYQWLLVTVTDKSGALKNFSKQKPDYLWIILIQILLQGIIITLFLMRNKLDEKNN
jgi:hypothetical protein